MNRESPLRSTFLGKVSLFTMIVTFIVMALAYSYVFGINILSRIFPSIPDPSPLHLSSPVLIFSNIVVPIFVFAGSLAFIWLSLKDVRAQKYSYSVRPETVLIAISLLVIGFTLQLLAPRIQPAGTINEILELAALILGLSCVGILVIALFYRNFLDRDHS